MTLTQRQRQILARLFSPMREKEIAEAEGISINGVNKHCQIIYAKLGVMHRPDLMSRYMQPTEEALRLLNPTPTHSPKPRAPLCTADSPLRKMGVGMGYPS